MYHGSESISHLGPRIWNTLPHRSKNANSTEAFKMQIRNESLKIVNVGLPSLCSKCQFCLSAKRKERKISFETKVDFTYIESISISYKLREAIS